MTADRPLMLFKQSLESFLPVGKLGRQQVLAVEIEQIECEEDQRTGEAVVSGSLQEAE